MFRKMSFVRMSLVLIGLLLSVVAACSGSNTADNPTGTRTPASTSSPAQSRGGTLASAAPVSYNPCVLVTAQEAAALTGVTYGTGRPATANGLNECIYGFQTRDVFTIGIAQAPALATAQADEAQAQALMQQAANNGLPVLQVQGLGDAAAEVQGSFSKSGATISASGIYVLKGTIFFEISDVAINHTVPGTVALQAQAAIVLTRL